MKLRELSFQRSSAKQPDLRRRWSLCAWIITAFLASGMNRAWAQFEAIGGGLIMPIAMGVDGATFRPSYGAFVETWWTGAWLGDNFAIHTNVDYIALTVRNASELNIHQVLLMGGFELRPDHEFFGKPFAGVDAGAAISWWANSDSRFAMNPILHIRQGLRFAFGDTFALSLSFPFTIHFVSSPLMFWNTELSMRWDVL